MLQWGRTFSSAESRTLNKTQDARSPASMGPHFFKCGKPAFLRGLPLMDAALQWGRTFSSAERNFEPVAPNIIAALQWGRTFSSAERNGRPHGKWKTARRFNGAALFQVRKVRQGR